MFTKEIFYKIKNILWDKTYKKNKRYLLYGLCLSSIGVLFNIVLPLFYSYAISNLYAGEKYSPVYFVLYALLLFFAKIGIELKEILASYLARYYISALRYNTFRNIIERDFSFFQNIKPGELIHTLDRINPMIDSFFKTFIFYLVPTLIEILFFVSVITFLCGVRYAFVVFVSIIIFCWYTIKILRKTEQAVRIVHRKEDFFIGILGQFLSNIKSIKSTYSEPYQKHRIYIALKKLFNSSIKSDFLGIKIKIVQTCILSCALVILVIMSSKYQINTDLSIATIIVLISYFITLTYPLAWFGSSIHEIREAKVSFSEIIPYLSEEIFNSKLLESREEFLQPKRLDAIELKNIRFSYHENQYLLKDITFKTTKGSILVITGPNGSGKTTLAYLLLGLIKPDSGNIYFDGINIKEINSSNLAYYIGFIPQEPEILNASFLENITLNRPATKQQVMRAASDSGFGKEFKIYNNHQHTAGEKGGRLSSGQKQKLSLARALLYDPPVLIFDEPSNHLDHLSFKSLVKNLVKIKKNKIIIIISHDVNLIRIADHKLSLYKRL